MTHSLTDAARLLAVFIGEDEIYTHQPDGDQVGAVSVNTWRSEITLTYDAAVRLLSTLNEVHS